MVKRMSEPSWSLGRGSETGQTSVSLISQAGKEVGLVFDASVRGRGVARNDVSGWLSWGSMW